MKPLIVASLLMLAAGPAVAADAGAAHPFNVQDLVMLKRIGDPQLSPNGSKVLYTVRRTDYAANKGITAIYEQNLSRSGAKPVKLVDEASSPRWSRDGSRVYFLSARSGLTQLWTVPATGGTPVQVTHYPLDINNFTLSPDGIHVAVSMDVYTHCPDLACTRKQLDADKRDKSTGHLYKRLFVRHWDTWSDGRRSQLFVDTLSGNQQPVWVSKGIDGDVPSKPFGDASEYAFSPDGRSLYFDVRIAGSSEPWSTNFDIYRVPVDGSALPSNLTAANPAWDGWPVPSPDGKTLYYLAQTVPAFESDRFRVMKMDLATGKSVELDKDWDHSPGNMQISPDGAKLYVVAPDRMQNPLFTIDTDDGDVHQVVGDGSVTGYALSLTRIVVARNDLKHPVALYAMRADGGNFHRVTHFNDAALAKTEMGNVRYFHFDGANDDRVYGYVVTPANFDNDKQYPVAFIVHGGPQGAMDNGWSYRWNPQTYAGQGFAVVTINFHGSVGFGQKFTDAISGDWGGKPLEDLKKGWKYALDHYDWLDGDRTCALGASYGGYMVYWMAGNWNKPWRCFVDHDGVFDTRMMYYATEELWFMEHEFGGPQYKVPGNYEKFNPLDHVANWRVPMLVVHSGHDFRIPITQGLGAFTALQRQGIPSEFLTFPDENHWVLKPHNSVMWHHTVNAWLKRWTAPKDKPAE
ncbi:MAG TPA: S9 family peptidase [Rhodanobacteraceae bacterium]|nr:S9 family peptidase [Rhodanobacteraceae bacterium]